MKVGFIAKMTAVVLLAASLGACANTIRGMGHDGANAINATQNAGDNIGRAARR